ncbi:hypothetical protein CBS14141_002773 [Malassezia furfur]|nr:hypothetical protein CBS14141_002773 [Malassezia furfur]
MYGTTPACQCDPATGDCGEQCMNRMMQICGKRGLGLRTPVPVRKGTFLGEYCGELIDLPEAARRVHEHYERTQNYYFVDYNTWAGELLDAGLRGNKIRFVNHSCEPNCKMEKWLVSGSEQDHTAEFQLGLFALRDIEAGEELSYNYGWSAFRPIDVASGEEGEAYTPMRCFCGAPSCTGWLGRARKTPQSSRPPSPVVALPSATPVPPQTALRVAKRPRGRPRKDAHAHADAAAEAPPVAAPSASPPGAPHAAAETPRRKRGRPRKHPHSETVPPDASVAGIDARAYADQPRVRRTAEAYAAALARQSATTQPKRASAEPRAARGAHAATVDEPQTVAGEAEAAEVGAAVEAAEAAKVAPPAEESAPVEAAPPAEAAAPVEAAEAAEAAAATESAVPTEPAPPKRRRGRPSKTSAPLTTAAPARAQVLDTVAPQVPASDGEERRDAPLHTPLRRKRGRPSKSEVAASVADRPMEPDGLADASVADAGVADTDAMDVDMADVSAADAGGLDARAAEMGVAAEAASERVASPVAASERAVSPVAASERVASPVASPLKRKRAARRASRRCQARCRRSLPSRRRSLPSRRRSLPQHRRPGENADAGRAARDAGGRIAHISAQPHRRRGRPRVHPVFPRASPPRWRRPPPENDEAAVRALLL